MSQTALITGASGGLGLEFAKIFSREGYDLLIIARREGILYKLKSELESQYHNHIEVFACDLSKPDAAYEVFNYTLEKIFRLMYLLIMQVLEILEIFGLWTNRNRPIFCR